MNFSSVLINITESCPVGCSHCGLKGAKRSNEMNLEEIEHWVTQVCRYGVPLIIFTGGEPFFRFNILQKGIECAKQYNTPSAIFTSSYWAKSYDVADKILRQFNGVIQLYLSTDKYHQEKISYQNVRNVIEAAQDNGITKITVCITYATNKDRVEVRKEYKRYGSSIEFYETRVVNTPYITEILAKQDEMLEANENNYDSNCWINTPIINPNGSVYSCHIGKVGAYGNMKELPYWLGNLRTHSFESIISRASKNKIYQCLRSFGSKGIARLLEQNPELVEIIGRNEFVSPCDLCYSVLSLKEGQKILHAFANNSKTITQMKMLQFLKYQEKM